MELSDITEEQLSDPNFIRELEEIVAKELAERDFKEFVKQAWEHSDPSELVWNWHFGIICDLLQLVSEGKIKKLLITIPPGFAKSKLTAVLWLAWDWLQEPSRYSIYATYAANLSNKFAKQHRDLVKSDWYQARWGAGTEKNIVIDRESTQKKQEFENNHKGGRFSTGKGGEVTGRRANIILFDDLNKSQDATGRTGIVGSEIAKGVEFLAETLWTRRILTQDENKKSAIVGICQRLHHADVAQWCIDSGDFVHLNLPMEAIWDERTFIFQMKNGSYKSCQGDEEAEKLIEQGGSLFWVDDREEGELLFPELVGPKEVADLKTALGPINSSAQLQQKPTPAEGALINLEWFREYSLKERGEKILDGKGQAIISVDTTSTSGGSSDWVVCQLWKAYLPPRTGGEIPQVEYYLIDQIRERTGVKGTVDAICRMHEKWKCPKKVIIEEAANGYAAIELLKDMIGIQPGMIVEGYKPKISKEGRVEHVSPIIQEGRVYLPKDGTFNLQSLKDEIIQFPYGKHDDQVDSCAQALIWYLQHQTAGYDAKNKALLKYYGNAWHQQTYGRRSY